MTTWRFKQTAKSRSLARIHIGNIHIPRGRRPVDPAKRDALAESIKIGTETPITVRRSNRAVRCEGKSFWELVAGNRLAPCKKRGIGKIDAFAFEGDCVAAARGEIGEKSASAIKRRRKPKPVVVCKPASEKSDFASGRRNAKRIGREGVE